jgi:gamma-glutamylcyclotransferase (GGCT)/AIG2-like uncharacterized protein YtfP
LTIGIRDNPEISREMDGDMEREYTFGYGSNMNYSDLRAWLESNGYDSSLIRNIWVASLEGYDFVWNYYSHRWGGGAANIEPKSGALIWGALIEYDSSLGKAFDRKEGYPVYYGKEEKSVKRMEDGKIIQAYVYIAGPNKGSRRDIWPRRDYKRICLKGAQDLGLPQDHIDKIQEWPFNK